MNIPKTLYYLYINNITSNEIITQHRNLEIIIYTTKNTSTYNLYDVDITYNIVIQIMNKLPIKRIKNIHVINDNNFVIKINSSI